MKKYLCKFLIASTLFFAPQLSSAQVITLGQASQFVVFTTVGAVTNSGTNYQTRLTGKVGSNSGSSTGFGNVDGTMHSGDAVTAVAAANLVTAYNQLNNAIPTAFPSSSLGNGGVFTPGVYSIPTAATLSGTLTLDGGGNANSVFIVKINGGLSAAANSKVRLINGALACNVYWKTEGLVSIGAGSTIRGTVVANNAAINMGTLDTLEGRLLSLNGAIGMNSLTGATPIGCGSPVLTGPAAPNFGAVGIFAIFSSIGPVTNSGAASYVVGDIGTNLGLTTGYNPLLVQGTIHPVPDGATAAAAPALTAAYNQLNALPNDITLLYPALLGHNLILTPHTYVLNAATSLTDTLFLNAQGNSNAVFVIKVNGALNTISGATVKLINGTQSKNVYWKVEGAVNLATNSVFHGNIVANSGAIDISNGSKLYGRALTTTGAITTSGDSINAAPVPNTGTIVGDSTVCVGSSILLAGVEPGGNWTVTNARATINNAGILTGVSAGLDTVIYTVTNTFGTSTTTKVVNVKPLADATVSGPSAVCTGTSITLTGASPGGTWSASNARATVLNGVVTGVSQGLDTIRYDVANSCGTASSTYIITVNEMPDVNATPNQVLCNNAPTNSVNYTGSVSGTSFTWTNSDPSIGLAAAGNGNIPSFTAVNNSSIPSIATVIVTPSANGCTGAADSFTITVNPTANVAVIANQSVCNGLMTEAVNYTGTVAGTTFTWTNNATGIGLAGAGMGNIPSFTANNTTAEPVIATITMIPSANGCAGLARTFTITVNPTPVAPVMSLTTPSSVCNMTYFRNFGAATLPPAGMKYTWSTDNAAISDTGSTTQYALVNFKNPGAATVILTSTVINTGCLNTASYKVDVTPNMADVPAQVVYFNKSFVVLQNREEAYTWGYDDASTLAPTLIKGEMNQDYVNANPDLINNRYWAMVTHNGCIQKTYYNKPEEAQMKMATDISVFPNPADQQIQVTINGVVKGDVHMEIYNMVGSKMYVVNPTANTTTIDVSAFPPGVYTVICNLNNEKVIERFIKN